MIKFKQFLKESNEDVSLIKLFDSLFKTYLSTPKVFEEEEEEALEEFKKTLTSISEDNIQRKTFIQQFLKKFDELKENSELLVNEQDSKIKSELNSKRKNIINGVKGIYPLLKLIVKVK